MKLTKYKHACFTVENDGDVLVVDPGNFATDFIAPEHVVAVIITHEHPDHFDLEQLMTIVDKNPNVTIYAHDSVVSQLEAVNAESVSPGDSIDTGNFRLRFTGGQHAIIHDSIPPIANIGVIVNDLIYYPGDSFVLPGAPVDTLALPAGAPWMKMSEAMDFLIAVKPRIAFPTHDSLLSENGIAIADRLFDMVAKTNSIEYRRLQETIEI